MTDRALRLAIGIVAVAGVAVAGYLTYVHYRPEALVCTGSGGCETVQESDYAVLFGAPVALLGLLAWSAVLGLTILDADTTRTLTATIALAGLGFAMYLVALQAFVIDAWCVWCLVNDVVLLPALAVLGVVRVLRGTSSGQDPPRSSIPIGDAPPPEAS